jgi:AcrR family transcriptional regulator
LAKAGTEHTSPRRKRRSPEEIEARILDAATAEFGEKGYSGATTAAIARRADVTEAQLFRTFASKAELFRTAIFKPLNRHFSEFHERLAAQPASAGATRELARQYIIELQHFVEEHGRMLMSFLVAQAYEQDATPLDGLLDYFEQGAATMRARMESEGAVTPELMVRVSFAAVMANVLFRDWLFAGDLRDGDAIREAIVDFTIDGISASLDAA